MRSPLSRIAALAVVFAVAAPASAIDPKFLPPHAEAAITINVKAALDSQLAKNKKDLLEKLKETIKAKLDESPAKEWLEKAGFDIMKDLHSITIAGDGSKEVDSIFFAVEGAFNVDKLVETAREAARTNGDVLKWSKSGNVNIFEVTPQGNEKTIYAGLIGDSVLVAAPTRDALNGTIARVNGGGKAAGLKPGLKTLLQTTNSKQTLSVVATGAAIAKGIENAPRPPKGDFAAMAQSVDGLAISVTVGKDIQFEASITSKDEDTAKKMAAAGNFGLLGLRRHDRSEGSGRSPPSAHRRHCQHASHHQPGPQRHPPGRNLPRNA